MRGSKRYLVLAALLPLALLTRANGGNNGDRNKSEPVLTGNVSDASTKKPVQGVTVSISNSKGQDRKEYTTDASGNFKVPQMPKGEVIIVLEKKGYKTFRREGVIIKEGASLKISFDIINTREEEDEGDIFHPFRRILEE
jgi:uncharacterized protein YfaS (alpha-2-macroglobulin family)